MRFGKRRNSVTAVVAGRRQGISATQTPTRRAVESLADDYRGTRNPEIALQLVSMLHQAFSELPRVPAEEWPPKYRDAFPGVRAVPPEIRREELTSERLGGAIQHHGCLLVRSLFSADEVTLVRTDLDRAITAREAVQSGAAGAEGTAYYRPFVGDAAYPQIFTRPWVEECGGVLAADSPPAMCDVLDIFRRGRVLDVVAEYLGEPPAVSVNKCTLRRVGPEAFPSWHQDGSFLGTDVRSVDVWVALTPCGGGTDAPGLGIAPRRFDALLPTQTDGAVIAHSIGEPQVVRSLGDIAPIYPRFEAGDALIFDELFVHCTGMRPGLTGQREALESWFFTPSTFPPTYIPLAV